MQTPPQASVLWIDEPVAYNPDLNGSVLVLGLLTVAVATSWVLPMAPALRGGSTARAYPVTPAERKLVRAAYSWFEARGIDEVADVLGTSSHGGAAESPTALVDMLIRNRKNNRLRGNRNREELRLYDAATERLEQLASQLRATSGSRARGGGRDHPDNAWYILGVRAGDTRPLITAAFATREIAQDFLRSAGRNPAWSHEDVMSRRALLKLGIDPKDPTRWVTLTRVRPPRPPAAEVRETNENALQQFLRRAGLSQVAPMETPRGEARVYARRTSR